MINKNVGITKHTCVREWLQNRLIFKQYDYSAIAAEASDFMDVSEISIKNDLSGKFPIPLARKHMWVSFINEKKKEWKIKTSVAELFPEKLMEI